MAKPFASFKAPINVDCELQRARELAAQCPADVPADLTLEEIARRALALAEGNLTMAHALADSHVRGRVIAKAAATTARDAVDHDRRILQALTAALAQRRVL